MARKMFFGNYIVDKEFQYSFILKNIVFLIFTLVFIASLIVVWNKYQFKQGFLLKVPSSEQVSKWAQENNVKSDSAEYAYQFMVQAKPYTFFELIWKPVLVVLFVNVVFIIFNGLIYSHKIAGPVYRLKLLLQDKLNNKPLEPLIFRKQDPFHELQDLVNKALNLEKKQ